MSNDELRIGKVPLAWFFIPIFVTPFMVVASSLLGTYSDQTGQSWVWLILPIGMVYFVPAVLISLILFFLADKLKFRFPAFKYIFALYCVLAFIFLLYWWVMGKGFGT